jgi:hypothetical protein
MPERELQNEINRLQGALEALGLVRERLLAQRDELGPETAAEAVYEMLTQVDALLLEFARRREALHPHHRSYQFLLTGREVLPLAHDRYGLWMRGEAVSAEFVKQTLRLVDWYVRLEHDRPAQVVNEHYSWLVIDEFGRADLHAAKAIADSPLPSSDERREIERRLFLGNADSGDRQA